MISGVDDSESIVRCIETGAEDFLPKPFDPVILRARIGAGLNRKRLADLEQERVRDVFTRFLPEPIAAEMLARSDGEPAIKAVRLWATRDVRRPPGVHHAARRRCRSNRWSRCSARFQGRWATPCSTTAARSSTSWATG